MVGTGGKRWRRGCQTGVSSALLMRASQRLNAPPKLVPR